MRRVFADTSFYVAVVNPRDVNYGRATEQAQGFRGIIFTTQYILLEVANHLSRSGERQVFLDLFMNLESDPDTFIIPMSEDFFRKVTKKMILMPQRYPS